jgi:acetyl esterase/lipase
MRDALADVPAELRSPQMAILSIPCTAKTLPIFRGASRLRTNAGRGVTVIKRSIGEPAIRVLLTTPSEGQSPCPAVLWIHGGGCVLGSPQMEAFGTGRLARDLGVVTVSPDYRLAAEHPFPAALDDCMTTLRWMFANADELGIDPDRIAVMGASAGGGLSAAVAQRSHDEGIPLRASAGIPDARRPHRAA